MYSVSPELVASTVPIFATCSVLMINALPEDLPTAEADVVNGKVLTARLPAPRVATATTPAANRVTGRVRNRAVRVSMCSCPFREVGGSTA
jgi:hypothetical protein